MRALYFSRQYGASCRAEHAALSRFVFCHYATSNLEKVRIVKHVVFSIDYRT